MHIRFCFFSPQKRNRTLAQDIVVKDQCGSLVRHSDTHVQRQQMLFARVTIARRRPFLPFDQALFLPGPG
jgi:hypothetical protein